MRHACGLGLGGVGVAAAVPKGARGSVPRGLRRPRGVSGLSTGGPGGLGVHGRHRRGVSTRCAVGDEEGATVGGSGSGSGSGSFAPTLASPAERFVAELSGADQAEGRRAERVEALTREAEGLRSKSRALTEELDRLVGDCFGDLEVVGVEGEGGEEVLRFPGLDAEGLGELGKTRPAVLEGLLKAAQAAGRWGEYQRRSHDLALERGRVTEEAEGKEREADRVREAPVEMFLVEAEDEGRGEESVRPRKRAGSAVIVLVAGFESFNAGLYREAGEKLREVQPNIDLRVYSDRELGTPEGREEVEASLKEADAFFGSLLFDFDQVEWLKERIVHIPVRLVFESALELMSETQLGSFQMKPDTGGKKAGPPPAVKKVLSLFGSQKEEDKLVGYLSFLKVGPKLLKFFPGKKVADIRNWLTVYGYWNQGGQGNVVSMFVTLAKEYLLEEGAVDAVHIEPVREVPSLGTYHPCLWDCRDPSFDCGCCSHPGILESPASYLKWHREHAAERGLNPDAPVVGILLYRKHVITRQPYLPALVRRFEQAGLTPLPIFINGVEAHTVVRDLLTSSHEQGRRAEGIVDIDSLKPDAVTVDAVVSTIGFPLVGGPAGSMEAGRQAELSAQILSAKNVPYIVSAPLLIQDIDSWKRDGVGGLQSVVLYSLPELDGAIDAVPLGGLKGDDIILEPERVEKLAARVKAWIALRAKPVGERKVAVMVYGFPPNVGATGTAALLNVPSSLEATLVRLKDAGYDVGAMPGDGWDGEKIVAALKALEAPLNVAAGGASASALEAAAACGARVTARVVTAPELRAWLGKRQTSRIEAQWGDLDGYTGLMSAGPGRLVISGLSFGNVWFGCQPLLGLEGDPMRLLFERDLTPHPQYAAFYKFLHASPESGLGADAVVHFGMHGTAEWLPGSPLGNTLDSWSDILAGNLPNIYVYAANNPSESIVAKRRGYGTIVSHNVPPYGRAGLYKELSTLKELLVEFREDPEANAGLKPIIADSLATSGLHEDCPWGDSSDSSLVSAEEAADETNAERFEAYAVKLAAYLVELEQRLFSEGLHVLGAKPSPAQLSAYLGAFFGDRISGGATDLVADLGSGNVEADRAKLEAVWAAESDSLPGDLEEALKIRNLLMQTPDELDGLVRGLNGEYIAPAPGGDLLRDGSGVLPTGRNIHALDPYRMPSPAAWERGRKLAQAIVEQHRAANGGSYPETVAVMLWGLDAIKTKGESLAIALELIGARPVKESTGRVVRFELTPLEELGRPRIDIVCSLSGIFRDSFANVIDLLDDAIARAANAEGEDEAMNFVKKHSRELSDSDEMNPTARIFSNPAGDYGSMVNERVGTGAWDDGDELGETWASRNAFSYGRGGERGVARPKLLRKLLASTDRIVQEIDSVEYGLTDINEYYANTGALKRAADVERKRSGNDVSGNGVGVSIVEAYGKEAKPKDLDSVLRMEYRSKLLNPKWAEAMSKQGSGGAYEISTRMTALIGWGGTAGFQEDWVYDQADQTYIQDEQMRERLKKANPQAFGNILRRMLEAHGRGMWKADEETIRRLQDMYEDVDELLEGQNIRA